MAGPDELTDEIQDRIRIAPQGAESYSGIPPRRSEVMAQARDMAQRSQFAPMPAEVHVDMPPPEHGVMSGLWHAAKSGMYGLGSEVAGAGEYASRQLGGPAALTGTLQGIRSNMDDAAAAEMQKLYPEEQDMLHRSIFSLDPHNTIWQGGPGEVAHSIALQFAQAAPSQLLYMLPAARLMKAGMTGRALTYIGATQAGMSIGDVQNNLADDIQKMPEGTLRQQSPHYNDLLQQGMDPVAAREQLIKDTQGAAPLIAGITAGAIGATAGRYMTPVLTGAGGSIVRRALTGAIDQGLQMGGVNAVQKLATDTAAQTYDKSQTPSFGRTAEAAGEGAAGGALFGAAFGAMHSGGAHEGQKPPSSADGVPETHQQMGPEEPAQSAYDRLLGNTEQPANPSWRGADAERANEPLQADYSGGVQGSMNFGESGGQRSPFLRTHDKQVDTGTSDAVANGVNQQGVKTDVEAAIRAHFPDTVTADMFDQPQQPGPDLSGPGGQDMMQVHQRMDQMPLQGGQMNEPQRPPYVSNVRGFTMEPSNMELPLRERRQPEVSPFEENYRGNTPDQASAEPAGDIRAQLQDLQNGGREGVYLSADNLNAGNGHLAQGVGVPLHNFDGRGGLLVARDAQVAQDLLRRREQGEPMQSLLGSATGAGSGKPPISPDARVVQLTTRDGNVIRESLVENNDKARELRQQWGRRARIVTPEAAIARRQTGNESFAPDLSATGGPSPDQTDMFGPRVKERLPGAQRIRDELEARRAQRRDLSKATEAAGAESSDTFADNRVNRPRPEAAAELINKAREQHVAEQERATWTRIDENGERVEEHIPDPKDITFDDPKVAERYQELHDRMAGQAIMANMADTVSERRKAKVEQGRIARKIAVFLAREDSSMNSRKLGRVAVNYSPETVRELAARERDTGAPVEANPRVEPTAVPREPIEGSVARMSTEELDNAFRQAAEYMSEAEGGKRTVEQIMRSEGKSRSVKEKFVNRYVRAQEERLAIGDVGKNVRSKPIALSPRTPLTAEETARNRALRRLTQEEKARFKAAGIDVEPKTAQKELSSEALMKTVMVRAETEESPEKNAERFAKRDKYASGLEGSIRMAERIHADLAKESNYSRRTASGEAKVSMPAAREYLRQLKQYGVALRDTGLRTADTLHAAERLNKFMADLAKMDPKKQAALLHDTFRAERRMQDVAAGIADPLRPAGERPTIAQLNKLREIRNREVEPRRLVHTEAPSIVPREEVADKPIPTVPLRGKPVMQVKLGDGRDPASPTAIVEGLRDAGVKVPGELMRMVQRGDVSPSRMYREIQSFVGSQGHEMMGYREKGRVRPINIERLATAAEDREEARRELDLEYTPAFHAEQQLAHRSAAREIANLLEGHLSGGRRPGLSDIADIALKHLPKDSLYAQAFRAFKNLGSTASVEYAKRDAFRTNNTLGSTRFSDTAPSIKLNRAEFERTRQRGVDPSTEFLHTLAHEGMHVATMKALMENRGLRAEMAYLRQKARIILGDEAGHYGLSDIPNDPHGIKGVAEFVAEAFSNPEFQDALRGIKLPETKRTLWDHVKAVLSKIFGGTPEGPGPKNMLEQVLSHRPDLLSGENYYRNATLGRKLTLNLEHRLDPESERNVGNLLDRSLGSLRQEGEVKARVADAGEHVSNAALSLTAPRQMQDAFSKYFERGDGTNPYRSYFDTFFRRTADNNAMMEKVGHLSNRWSNLADKHGIDAAHDLSKLMHDSTLYQIHPDVPLTDKLNDHLKSPEQKERWQELSDKFKAMDPELQQHYATVRDYYARAQKAQTDLTVQNMLHGIMTHGEDAEMTSKAFDKKYPAAEIRRLGLDTVEGLKKEFGDKIDDASAKLIAGVRASDEERRGPYFPLTRHGDFIVTATRPVESKTFTDGKGAYAYKQEMRAKDPTYAFRQTTDDNGVATVTTLEREVRMAEDKVMARQHQRELGEKYGQENVSPIQLRKDLYSAKHGLGDTGAAINRILETLEGNPSAQNAVKDFYLRSLSEQSFRKRELSRSSVRGVDVENQHRAFVQYGRSASYYLSQLEHGRALANSVGEIQRMVDEHKDESRISATRLGAIAREIQLRDQISRTPYEVNRLAKFATNFTQFSMMTSVSHWFVRGSQPYMLSVPWLAARHGLGASMGAMARAQKLIASPLIRESVSSAAGLRTLFASSREAARASAEKTYTVLDQVMDHIKSSGDKNADNYVSMLHDLRDNGIIDMSMATELKDIAQGKDGSLTARVLDSSRAMLHLVEVNNRAMTAIAAYDLAKAKGQGHEEAIKFARDAVAITHNDYSYGNTPRAFMAQQGLLGGARAAMTQFMRYPQHVYAMLVDSYVKAFHGASPEEKRVGFKTLAGILGTHLAVGGMLGVAIQPIKWATGLAAYAASQAGATDEPYSFANAFSGDAYNRLMSEATNELFGSEMGELAAKGLPAALGGDLSQRMALGTLYYGRLKTDSNASIIGSLMETFGGPWLSQLESTADGFSKFKEGKYAEAVEKMSPHIIRDIVEAGRISQTGLTNNAGNVLIPAKDITPGELFARSIGIQPEKFSQALTRYGTESDIARQLQQQKSDIIQRAAAATTPEAQAAAREAMRDFMKKNPAYPISQSDVLKFRAQKAQQDLEIQQYGAKVKGRTAAQISKYGAPYAT